MEFSGTVLLVSHEENFYREWTQEQTCSEFSFNPLNPLKDRIVHLPGYLIVIISIVQLSVFQKKNGYKKVRLKSNPESVFHLRNFIITIEIFHTEILHADVPCHQQIDLAMAFKILLPDRNRPIQLPQRFYGCFRQPEPLQFHRPFQAVGFQHLPWDDSRPAFLNDKIVIFLNHTVNVPTALQCGSLCIIKLLLAPDFQIRPFRVSPVCNDI